MYHLCFQNGSGVVVKDVKIDSPVQGKSGLKLGNVIYEINGCNVTSRTDWRSCIIENLNLHENNNNVIQSKKLYLLSGIKISLILFC